MAVIKKSDPNKTVAKKAPVKPEKPTKKLTVQVQLTALEARLKRANAATRKNVKTLEQLVSSLQAQSKTARTTQKAAFTRQVNALNAKLTGLMEDSQAEIAKDLSAVMSAPRSGDLDTLSGLEAAMNRADERLAQTEISQADAIAKINRHLANLANALETRFEDETAARIASIAKTAATADAKLDALAKTSQDTTSGLTRKVGAIETDTAAALDTLGGKIEDFAVELDQRQSRIDTHMGEKVSEIALQTQAEFETFRSHMDERIANISSPDEPPLDGPRLDGQMTILQDRLDNLEQYLADMKFQAPQSAASTNPLNNAMQLAPPLPTSTNIAAPIPTQLHTAPMAAPVSSNVVPINDAFAPAAVPSNPYALAAPLQDTAQSPASLNPAPTHVAPSHLAPTKPVDPKPHNPTHIPVEFDPTAYQNTHAAPAMPAAAPAPLPPLQPTLPAPIIAAPVTTAPPSLSPDLPPIGASGEYNAPYTGLSDLRGTDLQSADLLGDIANPSQAVPEAISASSEYVEPALPYADPAYAENDSLRAERIGEPAGGRVSKRRSLPKPNLSKLPIKGSPLKFLLIGSAVALLALFAGKIILGGGDKYAAIPETPTQVSQQSSSPFKTDNSLTSAPDTNFTLGDATEAPIGQYAENITPKISAAEKNTLKGAASSGNPIAQYQLGLTHLKASQNNPAELEAAVKLIRAAAAQNLPPAQYRLAKLYEIGQGVVADVPQARQLTQRAAKSGHRIAMHDLALYYTDGRGGVDVDVAAAEGWFEQAAQHGVVDSQFNLAVLSESKEGPGRDLDKAYFWYNIAAQQGDQIAQKRVKAIAAGLSSEQIQATQSRIAAFTPRPVNPEVNGVFRNVPWSASIQSAQNAEQQKVKIEQIRQAQSYLAELGYEVGTPDGAMGPRTRAAITEFEKSNALKETGAVDETLIDRLELAVGA